MKSHRKSSRGASLAQLATRRDLNATNQRRDARQLAKLDILKAKRDEIHKSLSAAYDRARWKGDPALAGHMRALLDQNAEMRQAIEDLLVLEAEDDQTHRTEAAIIAFDASQAARAEHG